MKRGREREREGGREGGREGRRERGREEGKEERKKERESNPKTNCNHVLKTRRYWYWKHNGKKQDKPLWGLDIQKLEIHTRGTSLYIQEVHRRWNKENHFLWCTVQVLWLPSRWRLFFGSENKKKGSVIFLPKDIKEARPNISETH